MGLIKRYGVLLAVEGLLLFSVFKFWKAGPLDVTSAGVLLAAIAIFLWLAGEFLPLSAPARMNFRLTVVTVMIMVTGLELTLRFGIRRYASYLEKSAGRAYVLLNEDPKGWLWVQEPGSTIHDSRVEFNYSRKINSLGIADDEYPKTKEAGEYRIVVLGDSYTEGVGATQEEGWVRTMKRAIQAKRPGRKITVIDAGVSGSDPWFEYMLLKERMLTYSPDLVVMATNDSDMLDIMTRGGKERFLPDGNTHYTHGSPWWEPLYGMSFIFRHVVHDVLHYDRNLRKTGEVPKMELAAGREISAAIQATQELGREHGFRLVVVAHPAASEAKRGVYQPGFRDAVGEIGKLSDVRLVDVLREWRESGKVNAQNAQSFFWPLDYHNNAKGYAIFADAVTPGVLELIPEK